MDTPWLLKRLEARGRSIADLARAAKRDRAALSRVVNGSQPLQLWMAPIFAKELGVSEAEVLSRTGELKMPKLSSAPIIPWHAVGAFAMTAKPMEVAAHYERAIVQIDSDTLVALRVEREDMAVLFPCGSIVIADYSQKNLHDRDLGVFACDDRCVLRRYRVKGKRAWLEAEDSEGISEEPMGEVVGRIVAAPVISRNP